MVGEEGMWLVVVMLPMAAATAVQFPPFEASSNQYRCYAAVGNHIDDHIMTYFYSLINQFINLLSRPFPHQGLLSQGFLEGNLGELQDSFKSKLHEWLAYEQWWLLLATSLVLVAVLFTAFYVIYTCCACCCYSSVNAKTADSRHDACKRHVLNAVLTVLITANIFAVASLLISSQYAEYGANELPQRLGTCLDDLTLYKRNTDLRVRKLLIDDFKLLNESMLDTMSNAGSWLIDRVKKTTGAEAIDQIANASQTAREVQDQAARLRSDARSLNSDMGKFRSDFMKLHRDTSRDLRDCLNGVDEVAGNLCRKLENVLTDIDALPTEIPEDIVPESTYVQLQHLTHTNVSQLLLAFDSDLKDVENEIQAEIDQNQYSAQLKLKQIGDDLLVVAETISDDIGHVNFDSAQQMFSTYIAGNDDYQNYVQYSWGASLVLSGAYALIALYFLFALCYGMCGRRPTYYHDDCCVRSTGSKLFICGIWLSILLLGVLAAITATLLFFGANISNLVCQPLHEPLSRPDMLSLTGRVVDVWRSNRQKNDLSSFVSNRSIAEMISACSRNQTLYDVFELDKKYHLSNVSQYDPDAYAQLNDYIVRLAADAQINRPLLDLSPANVAVLESFRNYQLPSIDEQTLDKLNDHMKALDQLSKTGGIITDLQQSKISPRVVSTISERLQVLETSSAGPIRDRLQDVLSRATETNVNLLNLTASVSPLLTKLQHAHTLLSSHLGVYLDEASVLLASQLTESVHNYTRHVQLSMQKDVTSCEPIAQIVRGSRETLCSHLIDPFNGAWASMLISLLCTVSIIMLGGCAVRLYRTVHPYSEQMPYETNGDMSQVCALATDTYDPMGLQHFYSTQYDIYSDVIPLPHLKTRT